MFTADMMAPCGLDCSICSRALRKDRPCPGCNGPDENKPEFCARRCGIILCRKRRENGYRFEALPADADGAAGEPAGGESLGSGTEPQGGPVYRDEAVTVTVDSITTDGKTVRAGFLVECAENRACVITTNIPEDWMTSIDVIEALRAVKRAGAGKVVRYCESGQSILCEFEWDLDKIYDTPFTFIAAPFETGIQGQTVSLSLSASGFPETAGFTLVECTGDYDTLLNDAIAGAGGEGLQEAVTGIICLQFSAE